MVKILLIVAALLSVGSLVLGYLNKDAHEATKQTLDTKVAEIATAQGQITDLNQEVEEAEALIEAKNQEISNVQSEMAGVRTELNKAKAAAQAAENQINVKNMEIQDLEGQIAKLKEAQTTAPDPNQPDPNTEATNQIAELQQQVEAAEMEAKLMAEKVEAAQNRVKALERDAARREGAILAKGLQGQILAVNPAWNFVVLSLGDRQGVAPNAEMVVRRGGRMIGKIRITSVEKSNSIADIVSGSVPSGLKIQPGDTVIYTGRPSS